MGNKLNPSNDERPESSHPVPLHHLPDTTEPSYGRSPFLRPERFCHTNLRDESLMFKEDYNDFKWRTSTMMITMDYTITVTDPRSRLTEKSVSLYSISGWSVFRKYPSRISIEGLLPTVDKAVSEIISAGKERQCENDAQKMSAGLIERKEYGEKILLEYCVQLYTQSSFLFRVLHQDLGDYYNRHSENLRNYEELLNLYVERHGKSYKGIVYRGAMLNNEKLKLHVASDYHTAWYSNTYLSTSKCRQIAELFGNTLMIIDIGDVSDNEGKAVDISELSVIQEEEEVLLTPAYMLFKTKQPEFDSSLNKHIMYFTSTLSSIFSIIAKEEHDCTEDRRKRNKYFSRKTRSSYREEPNDNDLDENNEF